MVLTAAAAHLAEAWMALAIYTHHSELPYHPNYPPPIICISICMYPYLSQYMVPS